MGTSQAPTRKAATVWFLAACSLLTAAVLWSGCSVEEHYEVLSFFFDGVPDPSAPALASGDRSGRALRQSPTYSVHPPFEQERCAACHGARFNLGPQDSGLCLNCHENVPTQQPRMHGPVVAAACLWCHAPHESAYSYLLKGPARGVCVSCHEPDMLGTDEVPAHADPERSCLDCHYGHGGTDRFFLRPEARQASPAEARRDGDGSGAEVPAP